MKDTIIETTDDGTVIIENEETTYKAKHDRATGDWQVISPDDPQVTGQWMETKRDAIKYALKWSGVMEDAHYNHAPDRTSA
jgi:hypothetical protein